MTDASEKEGLSPTEACAIAGVGKTKLYEAISDGQLVARKFGKRTIILRQDLTRFLAALPVTNANSLNAPPSRSLNTLHPQTVVEQLPAVASKAQPKEMRDRARQLNPPNRPR